MTASAILCPWGHRHLLPVQSAECWNAKGEPRTVKVTRREYDVAMELLVDGASNQQIAKRLYIAEDTVKSHVKKLLRRSGSDTRAELMASVFRNQIRLQPVTVTNTVESADAEEVVVP